MKFKTVCWIANLIVIPYLLVPFILSSDFLFNIMLESLIGQIAYGLLSLFSLFLWGFCLYDFKNIKKNDGSDLIMLVFLTALYTPFYYYGFYMKNKR
jgi:hypothetical protein